MPGERFELVKGLTIAYPYRTVTSEHNQPVSLYIRLMKLLWLIQPRQWVLLRAKLGVNDGRGMDSAARGLLALPHQSKSQHLEVGTRN
jgi:hypothetical protein